MSNYSSAPEVQLWAAVAAQALTDGQKLIATMQAQYSRIGSIHPSVMYSWDKLMREMDSEHFSWVCDNCGFAASRLKAHLSAKYEKLGIPRSAVNANAFKQTKNGTYTVRGETQCQK